MLYNCYDFESENPITNFILYLCTEEVCTLKNVCLLFLRIACCFLPCTKGVLQADPGVIREHNHIFRLYCHECQRVFHDRLVDSHDKTYFNTMLSEMSYKHFSKVQVCLFLSVNYLVAVIFDVQF